jgi:3-hydroxyisobutyrate dehydrogenase and related beta-hydroxyacid dehydrogenases
MDPARDTLGFIGLGVMGSSMAGHLLTAGYKLHIFTRSKEKAQNLIDRGAQWEENAASLAPKCSVIFSMLGYPSDVEGIYFGADGLIANAVAGTVLVDCTTSQPELAVRIASAAAAKGLIALDAPVSGGDIGARNAKLTIMVGCEAQAFEKVKPLLSIMGTTVIRQGGPGAGQHTKMANQIAIAGNLMGAVEAIEYAKGAGLDPGTVLSSIGSGSAGSWQLSNMVPRMLGGDFAPGFYVKHFLKDLRIALDSAKAMQVPLPLLELAESLFAILQDGGYAEKGTQALYLLYEERCKAGRNR